MLVAAVEVEIVTTVLVFVRHDNVYVLWQRYREEKSQDENAY